MDWINSIGSWATDPFGTGTDLNGSTAPNSSALPLSTPVNTSGGNGNTSGSGLGSFLNTLSGLGTNAANIYGLFNRPGTTAAATPTALSSMTKWIPIALVIGAVVLVVALLFRRGR